MSRDQPPGDPFAVLGLRPTATVAEVREARRRLAFERHPDRGGDVGDMQRLNAAFDACLAAIERGGLATPTAPVQPAPPRPGRRERRPAPRRPHIEQDLPSFTIDALPAEAFEALLIVATWIGDVLDDHPPYLLDCHLHDPAPCWCRLELVPDAGGSTVNLTVASVDGGPVVSAELVRDVWVDHLNRLGGPPP